VPRAASTLVAAAPAVSVIGVAWLSIEQPDSAWNVAALVAVALAVALLPSWRLRVAGATVGTVVAVRLAFGAWLPAHPLGTLDQVGTRLGSGVSDFYATHLAFDPRLHTAMGSLVLAAVFVFALLTGLLVAARKPVLAALALLAGAGWPETLLRPDHGAVMGAAILLAGLGLLAAVESRRLPSLGVPLAAGVVLAAVAVGSATASNIPVLQWQTWNLAGAGVPPSTTLVWQAQYGGLNWASHPTTMLEVRSRTRPSYLRAAVLDDFSDNRWQIGPLRPSDFLEPPAAFRGGYAKRSVVTISARFDSPLVGGSVPVRFAASAPIVESGPGFASEPAGLEPGFRYTVWSYSPQASAVALAQVPAAYPQELVDDGMLEVGVGVRAPVFGTPGGETDLRHELEASGMADYLPLARAAQRITRGAKSPYEAVLDLERWFLIGGGFRYSDHPRVVSPPLVGFVTQTRSGYCQYFAGAMALMLRDLGIPARVAVGFGGATRDRAAGTWVVTDRDAHAWVEVWFRGYGWLPFDPTPAIPGSHRSPLTAITNAGGSTTTSPASGPRSQPVISPVAQQIARSASVSTPVPRIPAPPAVAARRGDGVVYALLVLLAVGFAVGGVAGVKMFVRLRGRVERDPRRVAAACRRELVGFMLDQGVTTPGGATLQELGEIAQRRFGADAGSFVAAATTARFGRIEQAPAAARETRRELANLLDSCRKLLSRRERLRGLVSLRSLSRVHATGGSA